MLTKEWGSLILIVADRRGKNGQKLSDGKNLGFLNHPKRPRPDFPTIIFSNYYFAHF